MNPSDTDTAIDRTTEAPFHWSTIDGVGHSMTSIIHVTSWLSRQGGGIPPVIWALARETSQRGYPCSVLGLKDEWVETDCARNCVPFMAGNIRGPKALGFSPELNTRLSASVRQGAIIHTHGLWMHPGAAARKCAGKCGCPLIVSPHGMLEPWALNRSRWKKKLAAWWFEDQNLQRADCLHALCTAEAENFRRYGLKNPIAIIPNGVDLVDIGDQRTEGNRLRELEGRRYVLFLSRLHPKKGLANLLQAWRQVVQDFSDWCLVIAGAGEPAYEQELKKQVEHHGLDKSVVFTGPLYGKDKIKVLSQAEVFVLPSFSEGFSVAILEAAATGLPVLLTHECNFPELAKAGAAMEISPSAAAIENGLRQILGLSSEERKAMGMRGLGLMRKAYTWPAIAGRMCRVYEWLAGNGPRPEDVVA